MGVGWIDRIYNNEATSWYIKSYDAKHNGELKGGGGTFKLDDGNYHELKAGTHYLAESCGIPWYWNGKRHKIISQDRKREVLFYTSENEGANWIYYQQYDTGRTIARQKVPKGQDFHCNMRFEEDGFYIDVINNNDFSGENAVFQVYSEAKGWQQAMAAIVGAAIKKP